MTRAAAIIGIIFLAACGKPIITTHGSKLPDLVFAAKAPVFDPGGAPFVEAVWADGVWKIHDGGEWIADGKDEDGISKIMKEVQDKRPESRILISADKKTSFGDVRTMVRGAASAGFWRLDFLVSTGIPDSGNHAFPFEHERMEARYHFESEPVFIKLDAEGAVYTGIGPKSQMLDDAAAHYTLPELNNYLDNLAAAVQATGYELGCEFLPDPAVNHQRVIDVFSRLHEHGITDVILFVPVVEPLGMRERIELHRKLKAKPSPPRKYP